MKRIWMGLLILFFAASAQAQFAVGGGSFFAEEDETFNSDALFGAVHWEGFALPESAMSGVGVEVGYDSAGEEAKWAVWSLNRRKVAGLVSAGADMKVADSGQWDFDLRLVVVARLASKVDLEFYSLEENRPLAFAVVYRFGQ